jgi:hypothetical protein
VLTSFTLPERFVHEQSRLRSRLFGAANRHGLALLLAPRLRAREIRARTVSASLETVRCGESAWVSALVGAPPQGERFVHEQSRLRSRLFGAANLSGLAEKQGFSSWRECSALNPALNGWHLAPPFWTM